MNIEEMMRKDYFGRLSELFPVIIGGFGILLISIAVMVDELRGGGATPGFGVKQFLLTVVGSFILLASICWYLHLQRKWISMLSLITLSIMLYFPSIQFKEIYSLKQQVALEFPEVADNQIDDWSKVNFLRRWTYRHIDNSSQTCLLDGNETLRAEFRSKSTPELYEAFFQDQGGVFCGGKAYALAKLYQLYGFDAYTVNMGDTSVFTHVTTIVKIDYKGTDIFTVQDAHYNVTYVDSTGKPYDYFELLKNLQNHQHALVEIMSGSQDDWTDFIFYPKENPNWTFYGEPLNQESCQEIAAERVKCKVQLSLDLFERNFSRIPLIKEVLVKNGHPPESLYIFLYPFRIIGYGPKNGSDLLVQTQLLLGKE
ncbi:MAG: hypothetical protein GY797_29220 [Deltaproteobacteria bacterium]|nr:hypothetical protein [Deltaproteobacteria bacterium]